jgi:hypothetical protein
MVVSAAVLRGAVEALFEKRRMTYTLLPGRASFMVDASSGIVLYGPEQPRDTKVVVADGESFRSTNILSSSDRWIGIMKTSGKESDLARSVAQASEAERNGKALQKSFQGQRNEVKAMEKALSMSLMDAEKEQEEEEGRLQSALSLSAIVNQEEMEEVEKLQQVIQQSELEFQLTVKDDSERSLLLALELSRKECKEEDDELLRTLEKSMVDF